VNLKKYLWKRTLLWEKGLITFKNTTNSVSAGCIFRYQILCEVWGETNTDLCPANKKDVA
jgi:hypothetical protein